VDNLPKVIIDFLTVDELLNFLAKLGKAFPRGQEEYEIRVANVGNQAAFFARLQMMSNAFENNGPN